MRRLAIALIVFSAAAAIQASAQTAPPPMKIFASSAEVAALIAKAKGERKDGQANVVQTLLSLAPYKVNMEYRAIPGPAAVHEKEAEMFYVIDGSGTFVVGGKLKGETRTNPENLSGTAIDGGMPNAVAKGDFFIVPQNTPHQFTQVKETLVLMSIHVPRTGEGK